MTAAGVRSGVLAAIRRVVGPRHGIVLTAGAAAAIGGSLGPWASFFFGFPGKMTLGGFPGGARVFVLMLAIGTLIGLLPVPGRRRAATTLAAGTAATTVVTLVAIANDGGGLGALSWGAWLALTGSLLLLAGATALPDDDAAAPSWPPIASNLEVALIASAVGGVLALVWWGLEIEESSRFAAFVVFVTAGGLAMARLGLLEWLVGASERHRAVTIGAAGLAAAAFPFTQGGNAYWIRVFASIGVFAAAAIGLNVVVGLAGLLDLGYVAFFGVGAYVGALFGGARLSTIDVHLPFLLVILMGAIIAAIFGLLLGAPTLRLRGDYLAIVTLGFGEIFRISVNNLDGVTRGPNGIAGIPDLAIGDFNFGDSHQVLGVDLPGFANYYFAELVLLAGAILMFTRLDRSRIGRAWVAIREDETAASAMGVNTTRMKLLAFAIGAFLAGAAGTVNAHVGRQVSPDSYEFEQSILFVAAVVLGGMGTVSGALLGSTILFVLPEKLRAFQDKRFLIFGAALVLMMRFRPEGIVPSRQRRRELHTPQAPAGDEPAAVP